MAAQLAANCVFDDWDGTTLSLRLDPACAGLMGSVAERRLQDGVAAALGHAVQLRLLAEAGEGVQQLRDPGARGAGEGGGELLGARDLGGQRTTSHPRPLVEEALQLLDRKSVV